MKLSFYILPFLILFLILSFKTSVDMGVNPEVLIATYRSNQDKFLKKQSIHEYNYSVQYVPVEFKVAKLLMEENISEKSIHEMYSDYENNYEFVFQMNISGSSGDLLNYPSGAFESYTDKLSYLSFKMKNDIKFILDKTDTVSCADYNYERNFGISPVVSIVIGFESEKSFKNLEVLVQDELFQNDNLKFEFNSKDMKLLPKLKNSQKWKK